MLNSKFQINDFLSNYDLEVIKRCKENFPDKLVLAGVDGFDYVRRMYILDTDKHIVDIYHYGKDIDKETKKTIHIQPAYREKCYHAVTMLIDSIFKPKVTIYTTSIGWDMFTATDIDFQPVAEKNPEFLGKWYHYLHKAETQEDFLKNIIFFDYHIEVNIDDREQRYESVVFTINDNTIEYIVTNKVRQGKLFIKKSNSICFNRNNYLYDNGFLLIFNTILAINSGEVNWMEDYNLIEENKLPNLPIFQTFRKTATKEGYEFTWIYRD